MHESRYGIDLVDMEERKIKHTEEIKGKRERERERERERREREKDVHI